MTENSPPVGVLVPDWQPPCAPDFTELTGRYVRLERLDAARHARDLHAANRADKNGLIWAYLADGPYEDLTAYTAWAEQAAPLSDPMFFAIRNLEYNQIGGVAAYMRIDAQAGSIEVGSINFAPRLQQTRAGTEAIFLFMRWAFDAGYRRFEWKCNALNARSRAAAVRYGLTFEGIFRQALVVKGRNRDTAWYAAIDSEWPALCAAFETWLSLTNFAPDGSQKQSLRSLTKSALESFKKQ